MDLFMFFLVVCVPLGLYAYFVDKRRQRDAADFASRLATLTARIYKLEERVQVAQTLQLVAEPKPEARPVSPPPPIPVPRTAPPPEVRVLPHPATPEQPAATHSALGYSPLIVPKPAPLASPPPVAPPPVKPVTIPPVPVAAPSPPPPVQPRATEVAQHLPPPGSPAGPTMATPAQARTTQPSPVTPRVAQPVAKKPKRSFEEMLGLKFLPIIGITGVVLGVGFALNQGWGSFHPWLRVLILYASGFVLLVGGIFLERKGRYRILGRGLIGGGWAVIAATTYAIANLPHELVLPSKTAGLFLLLAVIGAMVGHTLRYNSQIVTGAAFLLGFLAIGMNPAAPYNLIAGAMLITGMTVIVVRRQWFELEVGGILASYLNHFYWLYQVYEQQGQRAVFPHHSASVALVIGYWAIFRASYLVRKISAKQEESVSTFAGLLNPILFLGVMKYQGFHPEWAWKVLLVMGAVEFILGQLPVSRGRRAPFQVLSSLGAALMVAAIPFKYSGNSLDLVWLAGAEAFLLAGIFTRERLFRGFGLIISFLVALHAVPVRIFPLAQQVVNGQPHHDGQISLVLVLIAAVLYANAHLTRRLWPSLFEEELESQALSVLSFVASLFAVAAAYAYIPDHAVAVALALFVAWLSGTGKLFSISEMIYEAHWVAAVAFLQVVAVDSTLETLWLGVPQRILAYGSVATLLYLSSWFVRLSDTAGQAALGAGYAWAATSLIALLIWFQATYWAVAVGWIGLALALSIAAQALKRTDFKWQAFVLVVLAGARTFAVNFDLTQTFHSITYRLITVSLIALGIYLLARWAPFPQMRPVYTVIGTLLLTLLAYKETETAAQWTAVAWITLALALCLAARWWKDRPLLWQTHFLAAMALAWTLYTNFAPQYRQSKLQLLTVGLTVALFYVLNWAADIAGVIEDTRISYAYAWAGSLLLSWLAWYQLDPANVALAWGIFGVILFEVPDLLGTLKIDCSKALASWHAQSYVALVCSFAHIFYANFNSPPAGSLLQVLRDPHVYTVLPLAPFYFYIYWRVHSEAHPRPMAKVVSA